MASGQGGSPRGTVHSPLPHLCHQLMALAGWGPSYICEGGRALCLDADPVWLHFFLGLYPGSRTVAGRGWPSLRSRQDWGPHSSSCPESSPASGGVWAGKASCPHADHQEIGPWGQDLRGEGPRGWRGSGEG